VIYQIVARAFIDVRRFPERRAEACAARLIEKFTNYELASQRENPEL
jgi:hypothetical protein